MCIVKKSEVAKFSLHRTQKYYKNVSISSPFVVPIYLDFTSVCWRLPPLLPSNRTLRPSSCPAGPVRLQTLQRCGYIINDAPETKPARENPICQDRKRQKYCG